VLTIGEGIESGGGALERRGMGGGIEGGMPSSGRGG
jgi:hypothetical protein